MYLEHCSQLLYYCIPASFPSTFACPFPGQKDKTHSKDPYSILDIFPWLSRLQNRSSDMFSSTKYCPIQEGEDLEGA